MNAPRLSLITTCKGRLHHLKQTLPRMAAQANTECIVVDYGCPQGTADWVREHVAGVKIIKVDDDPGFCVGRARNIGARYATATWLGFVDADISLSPDFAERILPVLTPQHYYLARPATTETYGTCLCSRDDFLAIGGYDENFRGWGGEDEDIYIRLDMRGSIRDHFPGTAVSAIAHSDEERTVYYACKDRDLHHRGNVLYTMAKLDLLRLSSGPVTDEVLARLYHEAHGAVLTAANNQLSVTMRVPFPNLGYFNLGLSRTMTYKLEDLTGVLPDS